ncbi:Uncharacterized protein PBTT_04939 [Plasmodiophora brassicae]
MVTQWRAGRIRLPGPGPCISSATCCSSRVRPAGGGAAGNNYWRAMKRALEGPGPGEEDADLTVLGGEGDEDEETDFLHLRWNCDQIRRKINEELAKDSITQTAFLAALGCNSNSLRRFMGYKGRYKGCGNGVYVAAHRYFADQEQGEPAPKKRKAPKQETDEFLAKVNAVDLDESSPIYDDCDAVRAKIFKFLETGLLTKTALCRHLGVNSNSMGPFLSLKGRCRGSGNCTYPKAYRFFERKRIAFDEPKSASRLRNEQTLPEGFPYGHRESSWIIVPKSMKH